MSGIARLPTLFLLALFPLLLVPLLKTTDLSFVENYSPWIYSLIKSQVALPREQIPVVIAGIAFFSHLEKITPIAAGLVELGYPVTFVTGEDFRDVVEATGSSFQPLDGPSGLAPPEDLQKFIVMPDGEGKFAYGAKIGFVDRIPEQYTTLQRVFHATQKRYGKDTPIVYIHDLSFWGILPTLLDGPGIRPISMSLGIAPLAMSSVDTYPFPALSPPDTSENATALHKAAYEAAAIHPVSIAFENDMSKILKLYGVTGPIPSFGDSTGAYDDHFLAMGLPDFDYPRTDLQPKLTWLGAPKAVGFRTELPSWWDEVLQAEKNGKHIVVVTQGSAFPDLNNLLVPTLQALKHRDDVLVIATLVLHEPENVQFEVPKNARLAKFVPFDILLPKASLLVASGGYGTVLQAIAAGVPMVLAGTTQDKGHIGVLADWAGIAVNLAVDAPGEAKIRDAVAMVLGDGQNGKGRNSQYVERITHMKQDNEKYDLMSIVDGTIQDAVSDAKLRNWKFW